MGRILAGRHLTHVCFWSCWPEPLGSRMLMIIVVETDVWNGVCIRDGLMVCRGLVGADAATLTCQAVPVPIIGMRSLQGFAPGAQPFSPRLLVRRARRALEQLRAPSSGLDKFTNE